MPPANDANSTSEAPASLKSLRVAALESRMSDQTAVLIERCGGVAVKAPSLRELPLDDNAEALSFAQNLIDGHYDAVIFLTGVGAKHMADAIETRIPAEQWRQALARTVVVARGPKPLTVLRSWGLKADVQVPEPNTWRDILETLDQKYPVAGKRIAIQEYGQPSTDLAAGLFDRGAASVQSVSVYRWALPEDLQPLKQAIRGMISGQIGALVITSAQQVRHLMQIAQAEGLADQLTKAVQQHVIVASVGPVATETLVEYGLKPDIEPEHPKLGPLMQALTRNWRNTGKTIHEHAFGPWPA